MVTVLAAVLEDGLDAVEWACGEALKAAPVAPMWCSTSWPGVGTCTRRRRSPSRLRRIVVFVIRRGPTVRATTASGSSAMERHEVLEMISVLKLSGMRSAFDEILANG